MPLDSILLNLPYFRIKKLLKRNPLELEVYSIAIVHCPHCNGKQLRKKAKFSRRIRHESQGYRPVILWVLSYKFHCLSCFRYFHQRFPGILPHQRSSEQFKKEVCLKHHDGITQKTLAKRLHMSHSTVERWYQKWLVKKVFEFKNQLCPKVLGIDEHFFTRKKGYATTFCDLGKNKVFDVTLGRSEPSLRSYLRAIKGKAQTKVVVMDLSDTYRSIAKKYFKNARIVADRFHVIRLINHRFVQQWRILDPDSRWNRGLISLVRRHSDKLSKEQREKLSNYFSLHPLVGMIYKFKQKLCRLMRLKKQTRKHCKQIIPVFLRYLKQLKESPMEHLSSLGRTLENWSEEIVCMWRFTKTNSITEGFHNKMEMISRRAFGFRNFKNYRLRIRATCC